MTCTIIHTTTTPCMVADLPAVVGQLTASYVQWRASARGGSKKNRKGGKRR